MRGAGMHIRAFIDNIDHEWMMSFLQHHRIADKRVLVLITRWLRTGVFRNIISGFRLWDINRNMSLMEGLVIMLYMIARIFNANCFVL